ncbi:MAG: cell division protein FtsA [Succinatimonas sp.]|nr:cell division protein FtsA [Succinatimonas sp.]
MAFSLFHRNKERIPQEGVQSSENKLFTFDLGSSVIRLAEIQIGQDETVKILGYCEVPSRGIKKSSVVDIHELSGTLSELVQKFENTFKCSIRNCLVAVPGCFISSTNASGGTTVANKNNSVVTLEDQHNAIENARGHVKFADGDYDRIHTVLQNYKTENSDEITNPLGQYAKTLDVMVHVVGLKHSHMLNLKNVFSLLKPELCNPTFIYSGIAAADAVLTESQKDLGVCLVDIGGGSTSVAVYAGRKLLLTFGIDRGGEMITQYISKCFGLPRDTAEQLKIQYGCATPDALTEEERSLVITVRQNDVESSTEVQVGMVTLATYINRQFSEIFRMVSDKIGRLLNEGRNSSLQLTLSAGFVITGGVAKTRGIEKLAPFINGNGNPAAVKISVGLPRAVLVDPSKQVRIDSPEHAVLVGMARTCSRDTKELQNLEKEDVRPTNLFGKISKWWNDTME